MPVTLAILHLFRVAQTAFVPVALSNHQRALVRTAQRIAPDARILMEYVHLANQLSLLIYKRLDSALVIPMSRQ